MSTPPKLLTIREAIKLRRSHRSYDAGKPLSSDDREHLTNFIANLPRSTGFFPPELDGESRFALSLPDVHIGSGATMGSISGSPAFVAGAINGKQPYSQVSYGYLHESIVIEAVRLGLDTSWTGGTFLTGSFAGIFPGSIDKENEVIGAVSAIGHSTEHEGLMSRFLNFTQSSRDRKEWEQLFFMGDFRTPLKREDIPEYYSEALEMVRLGPSGRNAQDWRVLCSLDGDKLAFHFYTHGSVGHYSNVDMGIALFNFHATVKEMCEKEEKGKFEVLDAAPVESNHDVYRISYVEKNLK